MWCADLDAALAALGRSDPAALVRVGPEAKAVHGRPVKEMVKHCLICLACRLFGRPRGCVEHGAWARMIQSNGRRRSQRLVNTEASQGRTGSVCVGVAVSV